MLPNLQDINDLDIFKTGDSYNSDLSVNNLYTRLSHINFPRSEYIYLDNDSLPDNNAITILTQNIRSTPTNFQYFTDTVLSNITTKCSVLGFTETRLSSHLTSLYQLPGYNMYTNCRNTHGGGVALYVSNSLHSTPLDEFSKIDTFIECIGVDSYIMNKKSLLICIYRSPRGNIVDFLNTLTEMLSLAHDKKYQEIFIFGDFNLDLTKADAINIREFCNLMYSFSLLPLTTKPTRVSSTTATLIDQIWSTQVEANIGNYIIHSDVSDHFTVVSQFRYEPSCHPPSYSFKRIISDNALNNFRDELSSVNWNEVIQCTSPDESFNIFLNKFNLIYQKHFPLKKICSNNKYNTSPHITPALKRCIREKNRLARLAAKWPLTYTETYRRYRNNLTKTLRSAKSDYYKDQLKSNQGNPKSHWKTINSLLGRANKISHSISLLPPCDNISAAFNEHFISLGNSESNSRDSYKKYLNQPPTFSMYMAPTNTSEVITHLKSLKSDTPGFDDISPKVLKLTYESLASPLTHLINLSLKQGIFPTHLKKAKVIPIYKSGNRCDINNYRPISILPAFSKIYEKIIAARLINYLEKHTILTPYQHGFRPNRSTETAILQFVNDIYNFLEAKFYVVGIFIDLSKAFDSLNHSILINKLNNIGISGVPLQLLCSYLGNRSQQVYCNNTFSQFIPISRGVPQGSVIGPILFLIYINDICNASSKFKFTIYADDTSLLIADKDINSLHSNINLELNLVHQWIKSNNLKLNVSKTNYILFQNRSLNNVMPHIQLQGETLTQMNCTKFLGVLIDEHLNWKFHIDEVCLKVSKICGIMYKIRYNLTQDALISVYYTLCYPHLTYCVSVWASTWPSFLHKVQIAQNKIVRSFLFLGKFDSVSAHITSLNMINFESMHKYFSLSLIYKMLTRYTGKEIFKLADNIRQTRSSNLDLICPPFRTALYKNSILCTGPKLFNSLPPNIKALVKSNNYLLFKKEIKDYIRQIH